MENRAVGFSVNEFDVTCRLADLCWLRTLACRSMLGMSYPVLICMSSILFYMTANSLSFKPTELPFPTQPLIGGSRKWFLQELGPDGMHKMLEGFPDKSAQAICTFAYSGGPSHAPIVFQGRTLVSYHPHPNELLAHV